MLWSVVNLFRGFAVLSALLAFAIAVLGSWVRINDAGLTCPDWPLCHGALVPALHGGVVLEWSHRFVAFVESFVVLGVILTGFRLRERIAGVTPALVALAAIFAVQVSLGGATVLLGNSPLSVMLHWGMGMALLAVLTALAVLAVFAPSPASGTSVRIAFRDGAAPSLCVAGALAFVTMCIGAYVSSSHAGLACTTVPACDGSLLGNGAAQLAQMLHRIAAFAFFGAAVIATYAAWHGSSRRVRFFATAGLTLVVVQIGLGIGNIVWQLPVALREAHAANAGATFLAFVMATVFSALEPYRAFERRADRALGSRRIAPLA
ncbi:MAG: COX15/CtaA family protein [Candidatus Eremiobacteraeota bacterium]|nr:COX15/CtaA family protein [Candidatus Eremiobacteraeota bacterium]